MKKYLSVFLAAAMLLSIAAGCGTPEESAEASVVPSVESAPVEEKLPMDEAEDSADSAVDTKELSVEGLSEVMLPLVDEETTLSFWLPYPFFVGNMMENMSEDISVLAELQKRTGITFDITAINGEAEEEQFNLMIASGSYCDVITDMSKYARGYDAAVEDGIILDLSDLVKEYAPNYWYYLNQDIDTLATLYTDGGNLPTIATLYKSAGAENAGYVIRQDWLEALNMDVPETYDEFEAYVEACNHTYSTQGIYFNSTGLDGLFAFGFDCGAGSMTGPTGGLSFRVVDGRVEASYQTEAFRAYLEQAVQWYEKGLIYRDFYLYGMDDTEDKMFCSGQLAANIGRCTSYDLFDSYTDENYSAVYAPMNPVKLNAEDEIHYSGTTGSLIKKQDTWSITEACETPELVMELVNYLFSEEGQQLFNWGVEGEAYTLNANGEPEYTDMMINDPDTPYLFTAYLYASNTASEYAPSIMDVSKQYYSFDDIAWAAYEMYLDDGADGSYNYPEGAVLTADELTQSVSISSDVETYVDTQILAFVTGQTPLTDDSWSDFQMQLTSMGIEKVVELKQDAYDRYADKLERLSA